MAKKRLDVLLFEKGLCPSRERAKTAIMEGIVYIAGQKAGKAGDMVDENAELEVRGNENAFVSRGGKKIEKFPLAPASPKKIPVFDITDATALILAHLPAALPTACCAAVRARCIPLTLATVSWRGVCGRIRV